MPSRRLLLSCLLLAACPPRTPSQPPPQPPSEDTSTLGEEGTPEAEGSRVPDTEVAPPAPDDPDAPDEPGEVEPGERPSPAKPRPSSTRADNNLADTLSPRASRSASRRPAIGGCEQGKRRVGETWKVDCNACSCGDDGQSTCTAMACEPAPAR